MVAMERRCQTINTRKVAPLSFRVGHGQPRNSKYVSESFWCMAYVPIMVERPPLIQGGLAAVRSI
jgi:hypothetical protein